MTAMFEGVKVVELAQWTFAPAAGAVLADFGADVVKIERPGRGDPQRALVTAGVVPVIDGVNVNHEQTNRGKRSMTIDLKSPDGRAILLDLVAGADVFLTNYLPQVRRSLRLEPDDLRAVNGSLIYAVASAYGPEGPDAETGGYDAATYWARGGVASSVAQDPAACPPQQPGAFGDRIASMNLAFGISSALYRRAVTGEPAVVEVSLLATALWQNASSVTYSLAAGSEFRRGDRPSTNPLVGHYETADHRWITLVMQESDRYWPGLCERLGRPDLIGDERFVDAAARADNVHECTAELRRTFAERSGDEWVKLLDGAGPSALVQTVLEAGRDPQAAANGYVRTVEYDGGRRAELVAPPVTFDESPPDLRRAPELGEHTEEILLALGRTWEEISELHQRSVI